MIQIIIIIFIFILEVQNNRIITGKTNTDNLWGEILAKYNYFGEQKIRVVTQKASQKYSRQMKTIIYSKKKKKTMIVTKKKSHKLVIIKSGNIK